ncbi:MAG: DUF2220 family protein [Bacillota bacterium]|nr:DUF2220 family protein [Bacillota bacterium]
MNYQALILNKLLDKYEKSKAYKKRSSKRRTQLNEDDFSAVDFENYNEKEPFFEAVNELIDEGYIKVDWVDFEEGYILKKIFLNRDAIDFVYIKLGRISKHDKNYSIYKLLKTTEFKNYLWMNTFKDAVLDKYERQKTVSPYLLENVERSSEMINTLIFLDNHYGEYWHERYFSSIVYNDSKYFRSIIRNKLMWIIVNFSEVTEEEYALDYIGIRNNPEQIEWSGQLKLKIKNQWIDFSIIDNGNIINGSTVLQIQDIECKVNKVLFVENRANYEMAVREKLKDTLVIYHGGFAGREKRIFFKKIFLKYPKFDYYHWSDIDIGGFRIFLTLQKMHPLVKSYLMDVETLEKYRNKWNGYSNKYKKKLKVMVVENKYSQFHELIEYMIKHNCRLEQENVEFEGVDG